MNDNETNIQRISFSYSKFKLWCEEKGSQEAGRSGQAWTCPLANYLAEGELMGLGAVMVGRSAIYLFPSEEGAQVVEYFLPEICKSIMEVVDMIEEGKPISGNQLLQMMAVMESRSAVI